MDYLNTALLLINLLILIINYRSASRAGAALARQHSKLESLSAEVRDLDTLPAAACGSNRTMWDR